MAEEVLISVKIDRQGNQNELQRLTGQIIAQKNEVKQLEAAVKTLSKAEGDNNELIKGATKNLEIKKQQLNQNVASQKALVNVVNAEVNSLNALKAQNAQLIRQRNQLNTETEEGRAGISRLNAQIDANNAKIKDNSSALEKQKINIGNYASALSGISPGIAGFISGLQGMAVAAKAFIATPLGLILGGIALALAPVVSYLTSTGEGIDKVSRETEGFNAVLRTLKDRLNEIGKGEVGAANSAANGIIKANNAVLDFIKVLGAPLLIPIQKVVKGYNDLAEAGRTYADTIDDIRDSEENYGIEAAKTENQIKRLALEAKNRTLSEEERIKKIDEALSLESKLLLQRKTFAEDEFSAIVEYNRKRLEQVGIFQKAQETQQDFVSNNINAIRDLDEGLATSLINSLIKVEEVVGQSIALEEKLQNQRDALLDKAAERDKKRREDAKKQSEADDKAAYEEYLFQVKVQEEARKKEEEERIEQNRIEIEQEKNNAAVRKQIRDKDLKEQEDRIKRSTALAQNFAQTVGDITNEALKGNAKGAKEIAKQFLNDLINMYVRQLSFQAIADSIAKYGPIAGPVRGAISASLIQALGAVAKSAIQGFATGGIVGNKGIAITRSNGDNRLITAKDGEVVLTNAQRARIGDDQLRQAGVPGFATGGIVGASETRLAAGLAESRLDINRLSSLINSVQTVLVLEEFQAKSNQVNNIQRKATVIG